MIFDKIRQYPLLIFRKFLTIKHNFRILKLETCALIVKFTKMTLDLKIPEMTLFIVSPHNSSDFISWCFLSLFLKFLFYFDFLFSWIFGFFFLFSFLFEVLYENVNLNRRCKMRYLYGIDYEKYKNRLVFVSYIT